MERRPDRPREPGTARDGDTLDPMNAIIFLSDSVSVQTPEICRRPEGNPENGNPKNTQSRPRRNLKKGNPKITQRRLKTNPKKGDPRET